MNGRVEELGGAELDEPGIGIPFYLMDDRFVCLEFMDQSQLPDDQGIRAGTRRGSEGGWPGPDRSHVPIAGRACSWRGKAI